MSRESGLHEDFSRGAEARGSSERSFGIVFAVVFLVIGLWPLAGDAGVRWWAVGVAGVVLALGLGRPALLAPLNRTWTRLGLILNRLASPVVMGVLFYLVITPTGLVLRALGKDPLRQRLEPGAKSYWIERRPPGPAPDTMRNQF